MADPRQIDCYIGLKTGRLTSASVVELAASIVAIEEPTPDWALKIACSSLAEVEQLLTSQLYKSGVLPAGQEFRIALKDVVMAEADNLHEASAEKATATTRRIEILFQLLPDYEFNDTSIPIVEFPYPPSRIGTPKELKNYLVDHIDRILRIS
jgi:hypothetical protein